jgi:hypothetical protein
MKPIQARVKALESRQKAPEGPTEIWLVGVGKDGSETTEPVRIWPPADERGELCPQPCNSTT